MHPLLKNVLDPPLSLIIFYRLIFNLYQLWMSCLFNVLRNLFSLRMYIDSYSKLCIFNPGFDFVNTLKKPEGRFHLSK